MKYQQNLWTYKNNLYNIQPLIHCITNPISMTDCANVVLALGGKPIMAQHPKECEEITNHAGALVCNLGNFDDIRAQSMLLSASCAKQKRIPIILDLVGVACSTLRKAYAINFIEKIQPDILKGNLSEIREMALGSSHAYGVDVATEDEEDIDEICTWIKAYAQVTKSVVVCSGRVDIISDGTTVYQLYGGHELMGLCTGTGCMLSVAIACYASITTVLEASIVACTLFNVCAQLAYTKANAPASFRLKFLDALYECKQQEFEQYMKVEEVNR